MATGSVADDPEFYGAAPIKGNFTTDATAHLWCAGALAAFVANDEASFGHANEDMQAALRYLLSCEVRRAQAALASEAADTRQRGQA